MIKKPHGPWRTERERERVREMVSVGGDSVRVGELEQGVRERERDRWRYRERQ